MTRSAAWHERNRRALRLSCNTCGANPGEWCTNQDSGGQVTQYLHQPRINAADDQEPDVTPGISDDEKRRAVAGLARLLRNRSAVENHPCDTCRVPAGAWCVVRGRGKHARTLHRDRLDREAAQQAREAAEQDPVVRAAFKSLEPKEATR